MWTKSKDKRAAALTHSGAGLFARATYAFFFVWR
jgi:hypothetical protein